MYVIILRLPINPWDYTVEWHAIELGEISFGVVHIKNCMTSRNLPVSSSRDGRERTYQRTMYGRFFGLYRINTHWNMSGAGTYIRSNWQPHSLYFTSAAESVKTILPKMVMSTTVKLWNQSRLKWNIKDGILNFWISTYIKVIINNKYLGQIWIGSAINEFASY